MVNKLTQPEKEILLKFAREALEVGVQGGKLSSIDMEKLPERLCEIGASFVTLTIGGYLRGCIGTLEASQPLIDDVREHTLAAAFNDYRFPPVRPEEVTQINIEISYLTAPIPLDYRDSNDLVNHIRPGIDGVVIRDGIRRATFLPQVWQKISDPEEFLSMLCRKMGVDANYWRTKKLEILVYQVEEFSEKNVF
jgi:AmmeMemoRadiSam system protein A